MSNGLDLQTKYIPHLRNQMANGSLVLFTGAGFSVGANNSAGLKIPNVNQLIQQLWEVCWPGETPEENTQLQDIFEHALSHHQEETKTTLLNSFTAAEGERQPQWYESILDMPWLRMYTLNIDDLAEKTIDAFSVRDANTVSATSGSITQLTNPNLMSSI